MSRPVDVADLETVTLPAGWAERVDAKLALADARRARGRGWNAADVDGDDEGDPASLHFE